MPDQKTASFHPREIELAQKLKEQNMPWKVQTGDWFWVDGHHHIVMGTEEKDGHVVLKGQRDNPYRKQDVVPLFHRVECREWLMENGWDCHQQEVEDGQVHLNCHRRQTEFKIEKTEPTELAAFYACIIQINDLLEFGWS